MMVAAGQDPGEVTAGDPDPTRQDCRTCHEIHTSYTAADWALETTAAVPVYAFTGTTYDGGDGNLCATCHQARRGFEGYIDGDMAEVDSTHWGPHHGPQSAMLLGIGGAADAAGALAAAGAPMSHYNLVANTCVTCHSGSTDNHTFEPSEDACVTCHPDAEDFDIGDTQTEVQAMLDDLEAALKANALLDAEGEMVVGTYAVAQAAALWDWIYVAHEDKSLGVHNPAYTKAILQAGLDAFQ